MRKRRAPDLSTADSIDPQSYAPDPDRLWQCVRTAGGMAGVPSLRFLAALAWRVGERDRHRRGSQNAYDWYCPAKVPRELWNELAWVIGNPVEALQVHTGPRISVRVYSTSCAKPGGAPRGLEWSVDFPKWTGSRVCTASWMYHIHPRCLYLHEYRTVAARSAVVGYGDYPINLIGDATAAIQMAKRQRWSAPRPLQIRASDLASTSPPPALAQKLIVRLWELQQCRDGVRGTNHLSGEFKDTWPEVEARSDTNPRAMPTDRFWDAVFWLFVKGYIEVVRYRTLNAGVVCRYRGQRRRYSTESIVELPKSTRNRMLTVFGDCEPATSVGRRIGTLYSRPQFWCAKDCPGGGRCDDKVHNSRHRLQTELEQRFSPLVAEALFYVLLRKHGVSPLIDEGLD